MNAPMTRDDIIEASLARAEAALQSRDESDLRMAEASLIGCLDWAARGSDEVLVRNVLRTVSDHIR